MEHVLPHLSDPYRRHHPIRGPPVCRPPSVAILGRLWLGTNTVRSQVYQKKEPTMPAGISILSFIFTRKPMPLTLSCQSQIARASLRW